MLYCFTGTTVQILTQKALLLDYLARGDDAAIAAVEERKKTPVVTGSQVAFTELNRALILNTA